MAELRILLVNRHMNIGGVETYLYRLAAGLVARGHRVGLLTEGGLWESKVVEAGARLHKVPSLAGSWQNVLPELRAVGYQIVHAHNYHSARVGRRLAAELHLPYLMSVHGPRPRLKQLLFRDWSRTVVVMSEGDRENIAWPGGVSKNRILLEFYGIDTDRFHPGIDPAPLRKELGLTAGTPVVAFISRFSNRKADVGHALLDAAPALAAAVPGLRVLLVGEGPESASLADHAARVNVGLPQPLARMIGPRRDVEHFMSFATVAVCTANTALESMACGTPTIAAGRTGFMGLVTPSNFEQGRTLCFADHGRSPEPVAGHCFERVLPPLLRDPDAARPAAREVAAMIAERYSVSRMAEAMERIYLRELKPRSA